MLDALPPPLIGFEKPAIIRRASPDLWPVLGMLPGIVPVVNSEKFSARITDTDTSVTNTNSPTFAAMDAGSPREDRLLIAAIHAQDAGSAEVTYDSPVTIGGVSATQLIGGVAGGGRTAFCGLWYALVPAGLTVDVAMAISGFAGTFDQWGCTLIRAAGLNSTTPLANATEQASDGILTLDTAGARFAIVVIADIDANLSARTPTSTSGGSTLTVGHQQTRGLAYIDTTPSGANTNYTINSHGAQNPDAIRAACWG